MPAEMNPTEVATLIKDGVMTQSQKTMASEFNTFFGNVHDVKKKARWLTISVVNMSTTQSVRVDDSWFDSGRFWTQPLGSIEPGKAQTLYVCDKDGSVRGGVSGGLGLTVSDQKGDKFEDGSHTQWVCSFSNPYEGSPKCLTRWKDFGIKPLFDEMDRADTVYGPRCGCHMKDDNHIIFIWKDPATKW